MQKFTKEQSIVVTGFTGLMACSSFSDLQEEVDKRIGYSTFTHQYGNKEFSAKVKELFRDDFLAMIPTE